MPYPPSNLWANSIQERIHQVSGNLVRKYNLQEIYVYDA